ncbi:hypothetical protein GCM10027565_48440 [Bordetella tumulicola]
MDKPAIPNVMATGKYPIMTGRHALKPAQLAPAGKARWGSETDGRLMGTLQS